MFQKNTCLVAQSRQILYGGKKIIRLYDNWIKEWYYSVLHYTKEKQTYQWVKTPVTHLSRGARSCLWPVNKRSFRIIALVGYSCIGRRTGWGWVFENRCTGFGRFFNVIGNIFDNLASRRLYLGKEKKYQWWLITRRQRILWTIHMVHRKKKTLHSG